MAERHWTPLLVEEYLVEAADTLQRLPEERVQGYFSSWPDIVHDYWDVFGREPAKLRRGPPTPAAIDRMDEVLVWLGWLEPVDAKILWFRASGERWKAVCWKVGLQRAAAHQHWMYGLCVLALKLNGRTVPGHRSRQHVIEVVRKRSEHPEM